MNVATARLATNVLAGICGALMLLVITQYAGWGRGYRWATETAADADRSGAAAIDSKPVKLPPASAFADIEAHPLFNEDRKPTPADAVEGADGVSAPSPLNVALTGVILDDAHHVRIAMLQDKTRNQAIALKVGMPLEGDQSSWTLVEVKPRLVVFKSAANETTEVELETAVVPNAGARPANAAKPSNPRQGAPRMPNNPSDKDANGSADLARRIEERRKQMREDAERLRNGGKGAQPKK